MSPKAYSLPLILTGPPFTEWPFHHWIDLFKWISILHFHTLAYWSPYLRFSTPLPLLSADAITLTSIWGKSHTSSCLVLPLTGLWCGLSATDLSGMIMITWVIQKPHLRSHRRRVSSPYLAFVLFHPVPMTIPSRMIWTNCTRKYSSLIIYFSFWNYNIVTSFPTSLSSLQAFP